MQPELHTAKWSCWGFAETGAWGRLVPVAVVDFTLQDVAGVVLHVRRDVDGSERFTPS